MLLEMAHDQDWRSLVTSRHLEKMVDYLESFPALALTSTQPCRRGTSRSQYMWENIAANLNRVDVAVKKNGQAWARYWSDWRYSIRQRYAELQRGRAQGFDAGVEFSAHEQRVLRILTDDRGHLIPTVSEFLHSQHLRRIRNANNNHLYTRIHNNNNSNNNNSNNNNSNNNNRNNRVVNDNNQQTTNSQQTNEQSTEPEPQPVPLVRKRIEDLRRELVEFELKKQKEMFEMELKQKAEKHALDLAILEIRKEILQKELQRT